MDSGIEVGGMKSKLGWKIFFIIVVFYSMAAVLATLDAFRYQGSLSWTDYLKWPLLLLFSFFYLLAVFGYCWKRYFLHYLFWYLLMWASLILMVLECIAVFVEEGTPYDEKLFLVIGSVLFLSFISRALFLYAKEMQELSQYHGRT